MIFAGITIYLKVLHGNDSMFPAELNYIMTKQPSSHAQLSYRRAPTKLGMPLYRAVSHARPEQPPVTSQANPTHPERIGLARDNSCCQYRGMVWLSFQK